MVDFHIMTTASMFHYIDQCDIWCNRKSHKGALHIIARNVPGYDWLIVRKVNVLMSSISQSIIYNKIIGAGHKRQYQASRFMLNLNEPDILSPH